MVFSVLISAHKEHVLVSAQTDDLVHQEYVKRRSEDIENGSETIFKYISRTQCVRFDGVCSIYMLYMKRLT
jgi:hypothetical protein